MSKYFIDCNSKKKIQYKSEHLQLDKLETRMLKSAIYTYLSNEVDNLFDILPEEYKNDFNYLTDTIYDVVEAIFNIYENKKIEDKILTPLLSYYEDAYVHYSFDDLEKKEMKKNGISII